MYVYVCMYMYGVVSLPPLLFLVSALGDAANTGRVTEDRRYRFFGVLHSTPTYERQCNHPPISSFCRATRLRNAFHATDPCMHTPFTSRSSFGLRYTTT
ncbi:hypothetical protein F5X98DRAFT_343620, partial [Xylaria grammica]